MKGSSLILVKKEKKMLATKNQREAVRVKVKVSFKFADVFIKAYSIYQLLQPFVEMQWPTTSRISQI